MTKRPAEEISTHTSSNSPFTPQPHASPYSAHHTGAAKRARTDTYLPTHADPPTPCPPPVLLFTRPSTPFTFSTGHGILPSSHRKHSLPTSPTSLTRYRPSSSTSRSSSSVEVFLTSPTSTKYDRPPFHPLAPSQPPDDSMDIDEWSLDFAALDLANGAGDDSDSGQASDSRGQRRVRWQSASPTLSSSGDSRPTSVYLHPQAQLQMFTVPPSMDGTLASTSTTYTAAVRECKSLHSPFGVTKPRKRPDWFSDPSRPSQEHDGALASPAAGTHLNVSASGAGDPVQHAQPRTNKRTSYLRL